MRETPPMVTCGSCRHFSQDPIGSGHGIGCCGLLEAYKQALKAKDYSGERYHAKVAGAEHRLGILSAIAADGVRLLYPYIERNCRKYVALSLVM